MSVARKLGHLFDGLRPTLVERIRMTQHKTFEEFLTAARLLSEAAEVVGQGSWAVNLLAEEKENQLQALAAVMEKQGEAESTPTLQQLDSNSGLVWQTWRMACRNRKWTTRCSQRPTTLRRRINLFHLIVSHGLIVEIDIPTAFCGVVSGDVCFNL